MSIWDTVYSDTSSVPTPKEGIWATVVSSCMCRRCIKERGDTVMGLPLAATRMIVCEKCGNKRCPHGSDHRHECTGSNEPGQQGSVYE